MQWSLPQKSSNAFGQMSKSLASFFEELLEMQWLLAECRCYQFWALSIFGRLIHFFPLNFPLAKLSKSQIYSAARSDLVSLSPYLPLALEVMTSSEACLGSAWGGRGCATLGGPHCTNPGLPMSGHHTFCCWASIFFFKLKNIVNTLYKCSFS